jgi:hypothetical protein
VLFASSFACMLTHLMKFQKHIEGCLESTDRPTAEPQNRRQKGERKLTAKWATWSYIDCCCDACPTRQRFPTLKVSISDTDLIEKDSLPELFDEFDDFLRILGLIQDPSDLSLLR